MQIDMCEDVMQGFCGQSVEKSEGGGGGDDRGCFGGGALIEGAVEGEDVGVDGAVADVAAGVG